jgi:hypothetical protein
MIINALNCGAKIFMADFEDSNTPTFDNLVTGQLNVRDASRRRYRAVLVGFRSVEDPAGTVSDIIPARIRPTAVEMIDTLAALQAAEPPSGAAIRPASSRSWSSNCTARRSWPRRWRAWASRCPSRTSPRVLDASVQGAPAGRHLADALDGPRHAGLAQHPDGRFDP